MKKSLSIKSLELIILLTSGVLYVLMAVFGRGTFWEKFEFYNLLMQFITFPLAFLLNTYYFIPADARKNRWFIYGLKVAALLLLLETTRILISTIPVTSILGAQNVSIPFIAGISLSWLFTSIRDWLVQTREIDLLKAEKSSAELAFLRTQVDPHFLFNTLNSMYASALEEESPKTAESIIMLSTLMRYNLHDAQADKIEIKKELDYIQKYIYLQSQRLGPNNSLHSDIQTESPHIEKLRIAPLLLIPLVENAFKYGLSQSTPTSININISFDGCMMKMEISNTIVSGPEPKIKTGLGLENLRKRLLILYPGKFEFHTNIEDNTFTAFLNIDLQS